MKKKTAVSIVAVVMAFLLLFSLMLSVISSMGALASSSDYQSQIDEIEQQKESSRASARRCRQHK